MRKLSGAAVVESVRFTSDRTTVYNLSVATDPSYLIGDDGVWVHNCFFDEVLDKLDDAIGFTAIGGAKVVDEAPTKYQILIDHGFTRTFYAVDDFGEQWTVFYNPAKGQYGGTHLSSSNP